MSNVCGVVNITHARMHTPEALLSRDHRKSGSSLDSFLHVAEFSVPELDSLLSVTVFVVSGDASLRDLLLSVAVFVVSGGSVLDFLLGVVAFVSGLGGADSLLGVNVFNVSEAALDSLLSVAVFAVSEAFVLDSRRFSILGRELRAALD